ncbi:MAG: hypothetical protein KUG76_00850 [Gammaproteobacteria bacterium]|nr:hypothetical protein [Gammaproteobacteria bacterium]
MNTNVNYIEVELARLSDRMMTDFGEDEWAGLLETNVRIESQLRSVDVASMNQHEKKKYNHVLKNFYDTYQLLYSKCCEAYKETEGELGLLRKQKSAGSIYQQVQNGK